MKGSEIIYNPDEVAQGKNLLSKVPENITSIAGEIDAGIAMIMSTTFKGSVNIDTTSLQTSAQNVETTISDITIVEQKIMDYSKEGPYKNLNGEKYPHWSAAISGGTFYSNPEGALNQMTDEYMQKKQKLNILTQKISQGSATPLEIAKAQELIKQVTKLDEKINGISNLETKNVNTNPQQKQTDLGDLLLSDERKKMFKDEMALLQKTYPERTTDIKGYQDHIKKISALTRVEEMSGHADSVTQDIINTIQDHKKQQENQINRKHTISMDSFPNIDMKDSRNLEEAVNMLVTEMEHVDPYISSNVKTSINNQIEEIKIIKNNVDTIVNAKAEALNIYEDILNQRLNAKNSF